MTVHAAYRPDWNTTYQWADADGDILNSTSGRDVLIGHRGGPDIFKFERGDGYDDVSGFEHGVDKLQVAGSPRQLTWVDTPRGVEVWYANFGQTGQDHFLLHGVHNLDRGDFIF